MLPFALCFSRGIACCAHRNMPVRFTSSVRCQSSSFTSSHAAVGPGDAALFTSVSSRRGACRPRRTARDVGGLRDIRFDGRDRGVVGRHSRERLAVDVADEDAGALGGERPRGGEADPARARGDEDAVALEVEVHFRNSCRTRARA
jgi:hypothetical protein